MFSNFTFVDVKQALDLMGGDKELYKDVVEMYLEEPQFSNEELQQALEHADYDKAQKLVHLLKGIAGTLGAQQLFELCKTTDLVFKKKVEGNIHELCEAIYPVFTATYHELKILQTQL